MLEFAELGFISYLMQHKSQIVNEELWKEAQTYGDIQLMPFVDYYSLITWKSLAICIFGVMSCFFFYDCVVYASLDIKLVNFFFLSSLALSFEQTQVVSAKFVMKTDDDAFVRVDEVLGSLQRINVARGLLYGLINSDSQPHRNPDSKWYISPEVEISFLS
jgi:beta-1,3-galactosyltransferase